MIELKNAKAYLEGIRVPIEYAYVSSGDTSEATIGLGQTNPAVMTFKPGMLLHLFIFHKGDWRVFFVGKFTGVACSRFSSQLHFTSIYSELNNAIMAPYNMHDTAWGHSISTLFVSNSDLKSRDGNPSQVLVVGDAGKLDFFNFLELQKDGSVENYVQALLKAAKYVSPWYKIQSDFFDMSSDYYVLNNPNIFPITTLTTMAKLINQAYSSFSSQLSYEYILRALLSQVRYKKKILNTPIKINGKWRWVILLPDTSWLKPFSKEELTDKKLVQLEMVENEAYPTRIFLQTNSGNQAIDISGTRADFIFSHPDEPFLKINENYFLKFTDEEKYRGPVPQTIALDNLESYYSLVDWSKPLEELRASEAPLSSPNGTYFSEMAHYKFLQSRQMKSVGSTVIPIFNPELRPIFPVHINQIWEHNINIASLFYTMSSNSFTMNLMPESFTEKLPEPLRWMPDEYKNVENYYSQYSLELMTENEYWKSIRINISKPTYYESSNLNAQYVANNPDKNIRSLMGDTIFCKERALPILEYFKLNNDPVPEITVASARNLNLEASASTPVISKGGMDFKKKEETKPVRFSKTAATPITEEIMSAYNLTVKEQTSYAKALPRLHMYDEYIKEAGDRYGVDPDLIRVIIYMESSGDTNNGFKGGLMHMTDIACKEMGIIRNLADPRSGILAGTKYLAHLINYYDGQLTYAVPAYNGGIGNVPDDLSLMDIKYKEYMREALGLYHKYKGM